MKHFLFQFILPAAAVLLIILRVGAQPVPAKSIYIGKGDMPSMDMAKSGRVGIVYGSHDSIMFSSSANGKTYSEPTLIAVLPGLFAEAMRGPQIASTADGFLVTACSTSGDIFAYKENSTGNWSSAQRVNRNAGQSKEGLMALASENNKVYAVWLEVKGQKGQQIVGTLSLDGGTSWAANRTVYASPAGSVCQCCKPSVVMRNGQVYVMFRNWLDGNRDLYLTQSEDLGVSFHPAKRLGERHWKLNGCPMDGGGMAVSPVGRVTAVWRRESTLFTGTPGTAEQTLGEGRNSSLAFLKNVPVYVRVDKGNIKLSKKGQQEAVLGEGSSPVLKPFDDQEIICVWMNNGEIRAATVKM